MGANGPVLLFFFQNHHQSIKTKAELKYTEKQVSVFGNVNLSWRKKREEENKIL